MRRILLAALAALTLLGLLAAAAPAGSAGPAGAVGPTRVATVQVSAVHWTATGISVTAGELLRITATGRWTDGSTTSGPDGSAKPWPDNFFNLADLGVCADCATTDVPNWGALIGYVGNSPPAPGSYASTAILPQALRVFYVGGNYEAKVLETGPLWLYKNADAYSGYTIDNSGHVTAKITVLPPETASQTAARARVAALSISSASPLQQALTYCAQSIRDSFKDQVIEKAILDLLPPGIAEQIDAADTQITIINDELEVTDDLSNGNPYQAEFDFGDVVFDTLGEIPGFELFGIVGSPAIDCVEAGFWLSGQLGGQLGTILRKKFITTADATASIAGTWTLTRSTISCVNLGGNCKDSPMILKFTNCTRTRCTLTRLDWIWKKSHPIVLKNSTWTASFTDITATCGTQDNPAQITLILSVTSYKSGGKDVAKSLGGTYAVSAKTNPPDCTPNISSSQDLFGGRS